MPITNSADETKAIAKELTETIREPVCIALYGNLGAGKTVFVKGIAESLGIEEIVQSPTFVIMRSYNGRMPLYHIDLYRIRNRMEIESLEEYLLKDGITSIEWADRIETILPQNRIKVIIKIISRNRREIIINDNRD